jgi:hypothetical protein
VRPRSTSAQRHPDDVSAQIDLISVPWLMLGFESLAAQNGGDAPSAAGHGT